VNDDELKVRKMIEALSASVAGLRLEVEGWRIHTGSTGYFLLTAIEDVGHRVDELKAMIK
jgi:hypothetical protein